MSEIRAAFEKQYVTWDCRRNDGGSYRDWDVQNAWTHFKDGWNLCAQLAAPASEPSDKEIESAIWHLKGSHEDFATARRLIRRVFAAPQGEGK